MSVVEVLERGELSLEELAAAANREHGAGRRAAGEALAHWIATGDVLLIARAHFMEGALSDGDGGRIRRGEWRQWLRDYFDGGVATGTSCMRLAKYQKEIAAEGINTIKPAEAYLRGLPPVGEEDHNLYGKRIREEAHRLYSTGITQREVGRLLGVSHCTVSRWVADGGGAEKRYADKRRAKEQRSRVEARIKRQLEREATMRKVGGSVAESYSMIRKTLGVFDRAHSEAEDREIRAALSSAMAKLHAAEDEIVKALGIA